MFLEHIASCGSQVAAVLTRNFHGFTLFRSEVGVLAEDRGDGISFVGAHKLRHYDHEIMPAFELHTDFGRALAEQSRATASNFDKDKAVRAICRAAYGQDVGNPYAIVKGCWFNIPNQIGFSNSPGIYLVAPGTNVAWGNHFGGFPSTQAANEYTVKQELFNKFRPVDTRGSEPDEIAEFDGEVSPYAFG